MRSFTYEFVERGIFFNPHRIAEHLRQFLKQPRLYFPKSTLPTHLLNFPNFLAFLSFCLEEDGFAREDCTSLVTRLIQCKLASYNFYPPPMLSRAKHFVTSTFVGVLYSVVHTPAVLGLGRSHCTQTLSPSKMVHKWFWNGVKILR